MLPNRHSSKLSIHRHKNILASPLGLIRASFIAGGGVDVRENWEATFKRCKLRNRTYLQRGIGVLLQWRKS
jgi:hypothetical protein